MSKLLLNYNEKPSKGRWAMLSFQHVFAMFGATILVPRLTGLPISVSLFTAGVGTLIYIFFTKRKVPMFLGSSFAYIGAILSVYASTGNWGAVLTGLFVAGMVYVIIAIVIRFVGSGWLQNLLPSLIVGPMIIIIGLSLANVAVGSAGLVDGGSIKVILTAVVSFFTVVFVALRGKGFAKVIPFLIGIGAGLLFASLAEILFPGGIIDGVDTRLIQFDVIWNAIKTPAEWIKIPAFIFPWFENTTVNVLSTTITFQQASFAGVLTIAPIALVTAAEHIGDHQVLGSITDSNYLDDPGLHRTLMGDGVATAVAALFGGPANTSYGENTSVVGITKVGSVWVTGAAAIIAILLSFVNVIMVLIAQIPSAVLGGISIVLYGFIAGNGLKVMIQHRVDLTKSRNLIIVSAMLVLGLGGAVINIGGVEVKSMALAAVVGILLNQILPQEREMESIE
ncbi:MAG: solute carrier family 23 protein [Candidatus Izemoplasmatales bacterium]|nr:solute carrier family 23 protein [Candidatus Izemoplasmatales bacterium]